MATIKAGYRITVTSWENDGDYPNTVIMDGLDEATAKLDVKVLKLIEHRVGQYGNMPYYYDDDDARLVGLKQACFDIMNTPEHIAIIESAYGETISDFDIDDAFDYACEYVFGEYAGSSENYYTRMAETILVEYVPNEITFTEVEL